MIFLHYENGKYMISVRNFRKRRRNCISFIDSIVVLPVTTFLQNMTKHHRKEFFTSLKTKNGFLSSHSSFGHSLIFLFLPKRDDEITFNCAILFPAIVYLT